MDESTIEVTSRDGIRLQVYRWAPEGELRAVVQIQHGLGEHALRYKRFAQALTDAGYLVYAPDGRGSGLTAEGRYGHWGEDSWPGWVDDVARLNARIRADHPGLPLALFGHSMGSFATQQFLVDHSGDVDAVVLSGTTEVSGLVPLLDSPEPADLSSFNAGFEHRTGFEWLSRDEAEVDLYVADEGCGFASEPFRGWRRPTRTGWRGSVRTCRSCCCPGVPIRWPVVVLPSSWWVSAIGSRGSRT